jgi:hypothetical protein
VFFILRDDEKREVVLSDYAYKYEVESRTIFCRKGAVNKKRDWSNILCMRIRLLLYEKCTVASKRKNGVAGPMIY